MGHTVKFDTSQDERMFLEDIQADHFMARRFGQAIKIFDYDTDKIDWDGAIRSLLVEKGILPAQTVRNLDQLSNLHTVLSDEWTTLDDSELNKLSKAFYDNNDAFDAVYRRFIKEVVASHCGEPVWWQATPTMRFHFPNQAGFNWKLRYHTDIMLGHPPQEVNVWVALTDVYGTNSMCLGEFDASYRTLKGLAFDFENFATKVQYDDAFAADCATFIRPVEMKYGQYVMFDPRCIHATQNNRTNHTRISIDLRVLPQSQYDRMRMDYRGTGRLRMRFAPGHYYDARLSDAL
jgi:ectoine hydroxylase-related dioxygenase (phytanoyl-CoA dioxygenase family)